MVDCVSEDYGCGGGWPDDALAFSENHGISLDSDYPYSGTSGTCNGSVVPQSSQFEPTMYVEASDHNDQQLKRLLLWVGPVSVAINADDEFQQYSGGVFKSDECNDGEVNHAVLLVGYNDMNANGSYWIVKNSWGEDWGEDGYIYMDSTRPNMCSIASHAVVPYIRPRSMGTYFSRLARSNAWTSMLFG